MAFLKTNISKKIEVFVLGKENVVEIIKSIGLFFQDQILGMKWLNEVIGKGLMSLGLDLNEIAGGGLQFFIYDTIKIWMWSAIRLPGYTTTITVKLRQIKR